MPESRVLVVLAITRVIAPRWLTVVGYLSAGLIATGVVIPLGVDAASLTNFVGYVAWCLWLLAMAVTLWRSPAQVDAPVAVGPMPAATTYSGR